MLHRKVRRQNWCFQHNKQATKTSNNSSIIVLYYSILQNQIKQFLFAMAMLVICRIFGAKPLLIKKQAPKAPKTSELWIRTRKSG